MSSIDFNPAELIFRPATASQRMISWCTSTFGLPILDSNARTERKHRLQYTALGTQCITCMQFHPKQTSIDVSSLEVTAKPILVQPPNGEAYTSKAYVIGAVETSCLHRKRGIGTLMMRRIQEEIDSDPEAQTSVLFSTIGESFFGRLGWAPQTSHQVTLTCNMKSLQRPQGVRMMATSSVPLHCDSELTFLNSFKYTPKPTDGKTHIYFIPTAEQMDWHFTASTFDAQFLQNRIITHRGAIGANSTAWVIWQHDFLEKKLKILHLGGGRKAQNDLEDVLIAALVEAMDWGFMQVVLWNPSEAMSTAAQAVVSRITEMGGEHRASAIFQQGIEGIVPSLRWTGPGEAVWEQIDYFSWC